MRTSIAFKLLGGSGLLALSLACDSCYGPINHVEHVRHVKRIQPVAPEASYGPTRPLEWGQFNVLHTVCNMACRSSLHSVVSAVP